MEEAEGVSDEAEGVSDAAAECHVADHNELIGSSVVSLGPQGVFF